MNTFKTVVMVCAMLAASCSGQYMSQSSGNQGASSLSGMLAGQYASQGQQAVLNTGALPLEQQRPAASPAFVAEQSRPAASPVMPAAPTTTQQICSCITVNPAAQSAAAASPVAESAAPVAAAPQQSFAAAPQQTFAAPQQTFAAAQQQAYAAPQPAAAQTQGRY
ncbi:hypothetical protein GHT06_016376 [Daphnia sinensis]|uniref:Uncharacterized protein n=1 Tax=Daphnia sinensis TaxID=1820382 RepID=A0AAD5L5T0_9CRUS|nr:hypothetical protein GHT06_016376 [Daphnia sinensis]